MIESAGYGAAGDMKTYGNQAGQKLLEERHDRKKRIDRLEKMVIDCEAKIAVDKARLEDLSANLLRLGKAVSDNRTLTEITYQWVIYLIIHWIIVLVSLLIT
jgi:hypothetical protein